MELCGIVRPCRPWPAHGIERAKPAGQRHRVLESAELKRLWRVWEEEFTAAGRPLIGEQFKLRVQTAQRGGEVLPMRWSAIDHDIVWQIVTADLPVLVVELSRSLPDPGRNDDDGPN